MQTRALLLVLFIAVSAACSQAAESPAAPVPAGAAYDPASVQPYLARGSGAAAVQRLRINDWTGAIAGLERQLGERPSASEKRAATILLGYAALRSGRFDVAARNLDAVRQGEAIVGDQLTAWAAQAHLGAGRADEALSRATTVAADTAAARDAGFVKAEALRTLGRHADAAAAYGSWADANAEDPRVPEARFRMGEALKAAGRNGDALAAFRRVYVEAATSAWAPRAEALLGHITLTAAERARRGQTLSDAQRHAAAATEWNAVLGASDATPALTCTARFQLGQAAFLQRDRPRAGPLYDAAVTACTTAGDQATLARALYQAGRSWTVREDDDPPATRKGIAYYDRLSREIPANTLADDARLRQAEAHLSLNEEARFRELLSGLPAAFPAGDMRGDALWRLAFHAWRTGDMAAARRYLEQELAALPREEGHEQSGRTLYWLGRVAARQGRTADAAALYERAVREYPLSYYALLGLNRLRESDAARASAIVASLKPDDTTATPPTIPTLPPMTKPCFARAVELVRLTLAEAAKAELTACGIAPTRRGEVVETDDRRAQLWLWAILFDRAGRPEMAHLVPRYAITDYTGAWPDASWRWQWQMAYPHAFADLIEPAARAAGVPPPLEFSIIREESAFDPTIESWANAIGLTQLTLETAQRYANGLPVSRESLHDPAINVPIGARTLGNAWANYNRAWIYAISAYNAGPGVVNRWRADPELQRLDADAWVEAIPYGETRGYVKRVLSTMFAYTWLYGPKGSDRVPVVPLQRP